MGDNSCSRATCSVLWSVCAEHCCRRVDMQGSQAPVQVLHARCGHHKPVVCHQPFPQLFPGILPLPTRTGQRRGGEQWCAATPEVTVMGMKAQWSVSLARWLFPDERLGTLLIHPDATVWAICTKKITWDKWIPFLFSQVLVMINYSELNVPDVKKKLKIRILANGPFIILQFVCQSCYHGCTKPVT